VVAATSSAAGAGCGADKAGLHAGLSQLAGLTLADLQRLSPATAAALLERLDSGRPELVQQVLQALGGTG
jgi:hypothetical protein